MPRKNLSYDGSDTEMLRLGLIDESGSLIVERRNEYKQYMQIVQMKKIPHNTNVPDREKLEEFFQARAKRRAEFKAFISKLFCRNK